MSQPVQQEQVLDFPAVFGDIPDEELVKELAKILGETDYQEVFRKSQAWYFRNSSGISSQCADNEFRVFQETKVAPHHVKTLLLRYRTEKGFSIKDF